MNNKKVYYQPSVLMTELLPVSIICVSEGAHIEYGGTTTPGTDPIYTD